MAIQIYSQKSNAWRDHYNPLRGMTLPNLVNLLEAGERGQYANLQWFYHYMERSDAMIHAVVQRRRAALLSCDWDVRQLPQEPGFGVRGSGKNREADGQSIGGGDQVLAEEQAAMLREAYDRVENFRDAVSFLFSGIFRGFGHLEKHLSPSGLVTRLEPIEQWFWVRDGMYGAWEYNQNAVSGRKRGVPIDPANFVMFETVPLNRMLSVLYLQKNLSQKDWDSFLEVYGIPALPRGAGKCARVEGSGVPDNRSGDHLGWLGVSAVR